jgi:hypothetical protein
MAKQHGARQQKRAAKQKAKRSAKRSFLTRLTSKDPTVRLEQAARWPVLQAFVAEELWEQGKGYLAIVRQESAEQLVYAAFMVDVYCLGVKNAVWREGTRGSFQDLVRELGKVQTVVPIAPACLVKIVEGAVEYARSFGFPPHPDYRHAALLLDGIDPSTCTKALAFGRDGKPFYIQGPDESFVQARAIARRVADAGGHYIVEVAHDDEVNVLDTDDGSDALETLYEDDSSDDEF